MRTAPGGGSPPAGVDEEPGEGRPLAARSDVDGVPAHNDLDRSENSELQLSTPHTPAIPARRPTPPIQHRSTHSCHGVSQGTTEGGAHGTGGDRGQQREVLVGTGTGGSSGDGGLLPGLPAVSGRDAIEAFGRAGIEAGVHAVKLETLSLETWRDAAVVTDVGKYVVVHRRQEDGSWRWAVDRFNSDAPEPVPAERS